MGILVVAETGISLPDKESQSQQLLHVLKEGLFVFHGLKFLNYYILARLSQIYNV